MQWTAGDSYACQRRNSCSCLTRLLYRDRPPCAILLPAKKTPKNEQP